MSGSDLIVPDDLTACSASELRQLLHVLRHLAFSFPSDHPTYIRLCREYMRVRAVLEEQGGIITEGWSDWPQEHTTQGGGTP